MAGTTNINFNQNDGKNSSKRMKTFKFTECITQIS